MQITKANLEGVIATLNRVTKSPEEPYTNDAEGKFQSNIGNFHLDSAYGGHKLSRITNDAGGTTDITGGYIPKRELYYRIHAYLDGVLAAQEDCEKEPETA